MDDVLYSLKMAADAKASPNTASYFTGVTVKQTGAHARAMLTFTPAPTPSPPTQGATNLPIRSDSRS
jgi:hypothetical protein